MRSWPLVFPLVMLVSANAWALEPAKHRALAEKACSDAGLPDPFCQRMGKQAYETDYKEWTNLAAHAQRELGQDRCTAADAAQTRVATLGYEVVTKMRANDYEGGAIALGRAIHTLQDECAHHGMTNEEHSYLSLTQTCTDNDVSPDIQPEAIACAQTRTQQAFQLVATALAGTRWSYASNLCTDNDGRDTCQAAALPTPFQACEFLGLHTDWDGEDSRWNSDVVGPALLRAFAGGIQGHASPVSMCGADADALDPVAPHAPVTNLAAGCTKINVFCLGKTDDPGSVDETPASAGCSAGGSPGLLVLGALALRRRRRRR